MALVEGVVEAHPHPGAAGPGGGVGHGQRGLPHQGGVVGVEGAQAVPGRRDEVRTAAGEEGLHPGRAGPGLCSEQDQHRVGGGGAAAEDELPAPVVRMREDPFEECAGHVVAPGRGGPGRLLPDGLDLGEPGPGGPDEGVAVVGVHRVPLLLHGPAPGTPGPSAPGVAGSAGRFEVDAAELGGGAVEDVVEHRGGGRVGERGLREGRCLGGKAAASGGSDGSVLRTVRG